MPQINAGRANVNQAGKSAGKRKVKRAQAKPVAGPPAPKRKVTVAPADRTVERADRRQQQLKKSVRKAGDAPQDRAKDMARAEESVKKQYRTAKHGAGSLYRPGTTVPPDVALRRKLSKLELTKSQAPLAAPALRVLEQTTRPLHAVANTVKEGVKEAKSGKILEPGAKFRLLKATGRGAANKDKTTYSDVFTEAGWKPKGGAGKLAKGAAAFTADVVADPTTYVTGGTGSIASRTAVQAAKKAEKKALAAGLSKDQAARMAERAHEQALKTADKTAGVTVKVAGKEVPGVRAATAKASKPARKVGRRVVPERVRAGSRAAAADVNPDVAPAGASRETSRKAVQATRTARSKSDRGLHEAQQGGVGIKQRVDAKSQTRIIDAIEAEAKGARARRRARRRLSSDEAQVMQQVRSQFRHVNRQRKQAGIRGGERKGYIPHHLTDEGLDELEKAGTSSVGRKVIRPSSSRARSEQRSLAELRAAEPGRYSEDLPNLYATRKAEGATAAARAELNQRIASLGTPVKKGQKKVALGPNDAVYHIVGSDISAPLKRKEVEQVLTAGSHSGPARGRYVVLNKDIVKRAIEGAQPTLEGPGLIRGYDKIQGGFKRIALATPGFHVRNLVGDTQNAYLGQGGHRLPRNITQAGRVLKAEGRRDKALRHGGGDSLQRRIATLERQLAGTRPVGAYYTKRARELKELKRQLGRRSVTLPRYGKVTYDEVAAQLSKHGGMRTGYTARELPELSGQTSRVGRARLPRKVKQGLLNREDLPRVATALDALKKGATWEEAAQRVADYHFDYAHLTRFERNVGRRVAPFYTFTARNVPLQVKSLVTKPGKFANYEKLREEAAKLAGMDEENQKARDMTEKLKQAGVKLPAGWEMNLSAWEQRNVGVPVKWKGQTFTVSMGLPLADLNEVPGAALNDQINEYYQKGMSLAGPLPKNIIEYMENHSFFFRDDIERPNAPLVAAPSWVRMLPADLKRKMGVTENYVDKKTGKKGLAYRAKADYIIKSIPGTPAFLNKLATDGHDRVGKGTGGKILSFAGVKATPYDPVQNAVNLAYDRIDEIGKEKSALNQQGINAKHPTKAYVQLLQQEKLLNSIAFQGRRKQGYKVLPAVGGPPKDRSGAGRVRLPGVSGRVRVPGSSSGRVKVP